MAALTVDLLGKVFPASGAAAAKHVLGPVRFSVAAGERLALFGPSGCGKTTLLNLLAGLDRDVSGRIARAPGSRLAYVFQEPRLLPWRTVRENVALVLPDAGTPAAAGRVATALAEVGLADAADVYASRLSLGMARRAALARAFVVRPDLLLLDEPFVSLDEATARRLRLLLLALLSRHRTTAVLVTHQLEEALMLADHLLVLSGSPARVAALLPIPLGGAGRRDPEFLAGAKRDFLARHRDLLALAPGEAGDAADDAASDAEGLRA